MPIKRGHLYFTDGDFATLPRSERGRQEEGRRETGGGPNLPLLDDDRG